MPLSQQSAHILLVRDLLNTLVLLAQHLRIYRGDNRMVTLTTVRLQQLLQRYGDSHGTLEVVVGRQGLLYQDEIVERSNSSLASFAARLFMHGVARIVIEPGVTPAEIGTFLELVQRKPGETGGEEGVGQQLAQRGVTRLWINEASDRHLRLLEEPGAGGAPDGPGDGGDLWGRFAVSLGRVLSGTAGALDPGGSPAELAEQVNAALVERPLADKQRLGRELAAFLVSLQQENIRIYRTSALEKLHGFVNNLSYDLKRLFLDQACQVSLRADFASDFYAGLADETIMDALMNVSLSKGTVPPMVLGLLGKLARQRGLVADEALTGLGFSPPELEVQARELFRPDDFEQFVPEPYRQVLKAVLNNDTLTEQVPSLDPLRATLELEAVEEHFGRIVLEILSNEPEARHLPGLGEHLRHLGREALARDDFASLIRLCTLCRDEGAPADGEASLLQQFETPEFIDAVLDAAQRHGKSRHTELRTLLAAIGPACIETLLQRLSAENNRTARYFLIECLKQFGPTVTQAAETYLRDARWYVQRNVLYLLRELNDPAALPLIRPHLRNPHPRVRLEALKAALRLHDPQAENSLCEQLAAAASDTVKNAVLLARLSSSARVHEQLLKLLRGAGFPHYHLEVRCAIVQTLAEMGNPHSLPALTELLFSHNLLHPVQHEQLKLETIRSLERYGAAARPLLERLVATAGGEAALLAADLLQKRHGGAT